MFGTHFLVVDHMRKIITDIIMSMDKITVVQFATHNNFGFFCSFLPIIEIIKPTAEKKNKSNPYPQPIPK